MKPRLNPPAGSTFVLVVTCWTLVVFSKRFRARLPMPLATFLLATFLPLAYVGMKTAGDQLD